MKINETKYDKNFILNSIKKLGQNMEWMKYLRML